MSRSTITEARSEDVENDTPTAPLSRRGFGKHLLLGASALAVLLASKHDDVLAAPTTPWVLGGNTGVLTNGSEFLGTKNVAPLIFKTAATNNVPTERMRITPTGNIGIGVTAPTARLQVYTAAGLGIYGRHTGTSGTEAAVRGDTNSRTAGASAVMGVISVTNPGADSAAVRGTNNATNANGAGVRGSHAGSGSGVEGTSVSGSGVTGTTSAAHTYSMAGVTGRSTGEGGIGVIGEALSGNAFGVYGATNGGSGVYGQATTGVAVTGANIYGGIAMKAQGNAVQNPSYGGWVKAMLRMQGDGYFVDAYNGVTGGTGTLAATGFSIASIGGGVYDITFGSGINVQYQFFSLSGSSSIYLLGYPGDTTIRISVGVVDRGYAYYIIVF